LNSKLGEKKLKKVITPDVIHVPLSKALPKDEETKELGLIASKSTISDAGSLGGMKKISGQTILLNAKIDEPSLIGSD